MSASWTHQESIEIAASPARIWALFSDVAGWKAWNAGIETIRIHGPFEAGTAFTMQPPGQDALRSILIEVEPNAGFIDETVVDGTRVMVSHRLERLSSGKTRVVYRTEITGPGAAEFGPVVTADFADVLASLKKLVEQPECPPESIQAAVPGGPTRFEERNAGDETEKRIPLDPLR